MKGAAAGLLKKYDALSIRERLMVAAACAAAVFFLFDAVVLSGAARRNAGLTAAIAEQREEHGRIAAQLKGLQAAASSHPDDQAKARVKEIEQKIAAIDATLQSASKQLVPPERMATLLEDLLKRNRRLQLVKMSTLPPSELIGRERTDVAGATTKPEAATASSGVTSEPNIFKHGVELTLRGSYFDMLEYLAQIEGLPWQMYWGSLRLEAKDYRRQELTLTLFTLSLDKVWLTI